MAHIKSASRRAGPLRFVLVCFVASGLIRLSIAAPALAQQYAALDAADAQVPVAPQACPTPEMPDELLAAIAARGENLSEREAYIAEREATLAIVETRIAEQMQALEAAEARLAATLEQADGAAESDVARLTQVYERMKPEAAAAIFEAMDVNFAAGFLARMQPDAAAGVLSSMPAELAYSVSVIIAGRNAAAPRN